MFIYKYNSFTKQYYKYEADDVNLFSPMFDNDIHDNNTTYISLHRNICMYCNTCFASRNKLFHHLSYMNINTKHSDEDTMDDGYQSDKGDYGYELVIKNKKKSIIKKRNYWLVKKQIKKKKRIIKKKTINDITNMLSNKLNIC
jgi:hypothetical protein